MSEAKFTKGPWEVEICEINDSVDVVANHCDWEICGFPRMDNSIIHDAHLIAAAPEMYELLSGLYNFFDHLLDEDTTLYMQARDLSYEIDALLSKARGE